ncbi:MAG: radical SAM protein [Polyangiales bacterium]
MRLLRRATRGLFGRLGLWRPPAVPRLVNWDLTYTCPLRCEHCYSESGRRPSRQLPHADLLRIADVYLSLRPIPEIVFTGGEPLVVRDVLSIAKKLHDGGARTAIYTSGYGLRAGMAEEMVRVFDRIAVSIDGDVPEVNDRIRGKTGAYDTAMKALAQLSLAAADADVRLGIECTVVRSNLDHLMGLARDLPRKFPRIDYVHCGAAIPTGLASEEAYAERELLDGDGLARLAERATALRRVAPKGVRIEVFDNSAFLMASDQIARGRANDDLVKIEADGRMRAIDIYEGTVGHLLEEPFHVLWARACARHEHPFVESQLAGVRTHREWSRATRAIDREFAAPEDLLRLRAR